MNSHVRTFQRSQPPFRHHLDELSFLLQLRTNEGRKLSDADAREQRGNNSGIVVDRKIWLKTQRCGVLAVHVEKSPAVLRLPARKSEQAVVEEILRRCRPLARFQIRGVREHLMPVAEDSPYDQSGIPQCAHTEQQVDPLLHLIDDPLRDQNLNANVGILRLKGANQRRDQRIRDAWRGGETQRPRNLRQMIRSYVVNCVAKFGAAPCVLPRFGARGRHAQSAGRALEQALLAVAGEDSVKSAARTWLIRGLRTSTL